MSSNEFIIRARGLSKSYPLYTSSSQRLLSLFNRKKALRGPVHHALENINLDIARGEKVAIIGRNGAGKSTLLKLVTRAIEPSEGELTIAGKSQALLQLGVGFHPEFSGRENAFSFLAHMGKSGKVAEELVEEAIAFAEIEEYIDQPLKTYSSGMAARLMFAVSTIMDPELLVIDEVLGVGDAYFQNKSFERIREMCDEHGTTLLLVTHDIYSAAKLCERMIWVERGRIYADGVPEDILKLYENSIRVQEDGRQKQKLALAYRSAVNNSNIRPLFLELRSRNNEPASSPLFITEASFVGDDGEILELPLFAESLKSNRGYFIQQLPHTAWGDVVQHDGHQARVWNNFGVVEHKVGYALFPELDNIQWLENARLLLRYACNDIVDADVVYVSQSGDERVLGRIQSNPGSWETSEFSVQDGSMVDATEKRTESAVQRQGSGRVVATTFRLVDTEGRDCHVVEHGCAVTIKIDYRINDISMDEKCQVVLVFKRNGVDDVFRVRSTELRFVATQSRAGVIEVDLNPLRLGVARYTVTFLIAKEDYYENSDGRFFSINPDVYDCQSACLEFEVIDHKSLIAKGTGIVGSGEWRLSFPQEVTHD